jgi:hypothetical protein
MLLTVLKVTDDLLLHTLWDLLVPHQYHHWLRDKPQCVEGVVHYSRSQPAGYVTEAHEGTACCINR